MKTFDIVLVRLLQFLVLLFFTFAVVLWYGCASVIPLALWINLTGFFSALIHPSIAALVSLLITGALSFYLARIPKLLETFLATGIDLIKLGHSSSERLAEIARAIRQEARVQHHKVEVVLKN